MRRHGTYYRETRDPQGAEQTTTPDQSAAYEGHSWLHRQTVRQPEASQQLTLDPAYGQMTSPKEVSAQEPTQEQRSTTSMTVKRRELTELGEPIHKERYTADGMKSLELEFHEKIELLKSERGENDELTMEFEKGGNKLISNIKSKAEGIKRSENLRREVDESAAKAMGMTIDAYYKKYGKRIVQRGSEESRERRKHDNIREELMHLDTIYRKLKSLVKEISDEVEEEQYEVSDEE